MKRTLSLILALILVFSLCACGKKASSSPSASAPESQPSSANPGASSSDAALPTPEREAGGPAAPDPYTAATTVEYTFAWLGSKNAFQDGVAWVSLGSPDCLIALINKNAEVINIFDHTRLTPNYYKVTATRYINGVAALYYNDENMYQPSSGFVLVDTAGEVIYESTDESLYMCSQLPDGRYLLARHESGFAGDNWYYLLMNPDLTTSRVEIGPVHSVYMKSEYSQVSDDLFYSDHLFLNFGTGSIYSTNDPNGWSSSVGYLGNNGEYACFADYAVSSGAVYLVPIEALNTVTSYQELLDLVLSDSSILLKYAPSFGPGSGLVYTGLEEDDRVTDWSLHYTDQSGIYRVVMNAFGNEVKRRDFLDLDGNVLFEFPTFPQGVSYESVFRFSGGYAPLVLFGADQNLYVTLIDTAGNLQYDPVNTGMNRNTIYPTNHLWSCSGYIFNTFPDELMIVDPTGAVKHLGDDLSGLRGAVWFTDNIQIDEDYIMYDSSKYTEYAAVDGSSVFSSVTAKYNADGHLLYTGPGGEVVISEQVFPKYVVTQKPADTLPKRDYIHPDEFSIEGKWKNVGPYTYGQAQKGAILVFDGEHCNLVSPSDTYAFYKDGDDFRLDCTTVGFSDTMSFAVRILNDKNIDIINGSNIIELARVS